VNLNSSENIKFLQTVKEFLTPFNSVTSFFEMIIAELGFQKDGTSPFKNLELKEFIDIFIRGFKKDTELSSNIKLVKTVNYYVDQLREEYDIYAEFVGDDSDYQAEEVSVISDGSIGEEEKEDADEVALDDEETDDDDDDDDFSMDDLLAKYSGK
jgi:hypothetical protein